MNKFKMTKRAIGTGIISLFVCFAMLLGTTYAWFTDSVTSAGNIIQSGTLDVEMYYADGAADPTAETTEWVDASVESIYGANTLWEPGYTDAKHIKIANVGTLSLKWQLAIIPTGEVSMLADVIDVYYTANATTPVDRNDLGTYVGTLADIINNGIDAGTLDAKAVYVSTFVLKMRESIGNEYQNLSIGSGFAVQLLATQYTSESDSFGNDYDKDAVYAEHYVTDAAGLAAAFQAGGTVALMNDIVLSDATRAATTNFGFVIPKNANVVLNLNGNNIIKTTEISDVNGDGKITSADNHGVFQVKGNLAIVGNGTVSMKDNGGDMGWNALSAVFSVESGTLSLGKGVTVIHNGGTSMAYAVDVNTTGGASTLNIDGAVLSSTYVGVRLFNNNQTQSAKIILNTGAIDGAKRDIWVHNPGAAAVDANAIVNIADGYVFTKTVQDESSFFGRIYDFNTVVVNDAASLAAALEADKTVYLTTSFAELAVQTVAPYGNWYGIKIADGVLDGQGNTVDFELGPKNNNGKYDNYGIMISGGTIKNLTVTGVFRGIMIMNPTKDIYIDNVVIGDDDVCYSINTGEGDGTHSLYVSNSTIKGWSSYGTAIKDVTFTNCTFAQGTYYTDVYGRIVKPYVNTVFKNCEFNSRSYIDLSALVADAKIVLENCTVNGVLLTADNWQQLIASESDCTESQISIEARDGSYMTASNILDYVIIK